MEELFNSIPIGVPIVLFFNIPYKDEEVLVTDKTKHSDYSYSLFATSLDKKFAQYYWIKPKHPDYFGKKIIGFARISDESNT